MLTQILYGNLDANTDTVWGEMTRFFKKSGSRDPGWIQWSKGHAQSNHHDFTPWYQTSGEPPIRSWN
jgi:hypothetical protein